MDDLPGGMLGPLVGLGTAAAVYLGWLLFHRLLPPALHVAHGLWIVLSLAVGFAGWWMTPDPDGHYEATRVDAWQARRQALDSRTEWRALGDAWRAMGEVSAALSPHSAEAPEVVARVDGLEPRLARGLDGLGPLVADGMLSAEEARSLAALAVRRFVYLKREAGPPRPQEVPGSLLDDHCATLESRYRFLGRVQEVPESDLLLWQQRVRLARELAMLDRILEEQSSEEDLARQARRGGPSFAAVPDRLRALSLLAVDLSLPPLDGPAGCDPAERSLCSEEQAKACDAAGMPARGSSCGEPAPPAAAGACCR